MPRFFFHVMDGHVHMDANGTELPDIGAVRQEAVRAAGEILADANLADLPGSEAWQLVVADASGKTVYTLRLVATDYD